MNISGLNKKLNKEFNGRVQARYEDNCIFVTGSLDDWNEVVRACMMCAEPHSKCHVVNDIVFTGAEIAPMRMPSLRDTALDGRRPDVLIVGGGISGASIARELSRYKLDILLIDKEADLALAASGRNDGEVHPGVDLSRGSLKHKYIRRANRMYDRVCAELQVPFIRPGQYACAEEWSMLLVAVPFALIRRFVDGIEDTRIISGKKLRQIEPELGDFLFALSNPSSGCVSPYQLTIAYAENAVQNGAEVSLNTALTGMEVSDGKIISVSTNRGTVYPRLVINAAGVFSEEIARMAQDRFFSIHPRRGTNSIFDKKLGAKFHSIASVKGLSNPAVTHTKGGGLLHTAHDNVLMGPDAVETWEKENTATTPESIEQVYSKQKITMPGLNKSDIITYFTGVRAPTFEEDFIIERGRKTENIIHVAGIQSPGLTTAPAVAEDVAEMAVKALGYAVKKADFDPIRPAPPVLSKMSDEERAKLIAQNPDYGVIVCRCEEVSRGEILDALRSPICVPTLDGVKKRVRPGMGRCQGGFCSPLVTKIIAEYLNVPIEDVRKSSAESPIVFKSEKGEKHE